MNLAYIDNSNDYPDLVQKAWSAATDDSDAAMNYYGPGITEQPLLLDTDGIPQPLHYAPDLDSAKLLSKQQIDYLATNSNNWFLVDVDFDHTLLRDYGLRLARYLKRQGVEDHRIVLFTQYTGRVLESEKTDGSAWVDVIDKLEFQGPYEIALQRLTLRFRGWLHECALRESISARAKMVKTATKTGLIGHSVEWLKALEAAGYAASKEMHVLLIGETGSGKDELAKLIHHRSARSRGPYHELNCAASRGDLWDDTLFGHEAGAFSNVKGARPSVFQTADHGVLFVNELQALNKGEQDKLKQAVEQGKFKQQGSNAMISFNVRFVFASRFPLEQLVRSDQFLEDLYFRINIQRIDVPSVRDREGDALDLSDHFLARASKELRLSKKITLSAEARDEIVRYDWPGNVQTSRIV